MTEEAAPADAPTLPQLLSKGVARSVSATPAVFDGRDAVRVELLESISRDGVSDVDYVDMPTFLELPLTFEDGTISVDVRALDAYVDDVLTLAVDPTLLPPRRGRIGLFVDIGTVAWFSNLQVSHAAT